MRKGTFTYAACLVAVGSVFVAQANAGRFSKKSNVSFRAASSEPVTDFSKMAMDGEVVYVSPVDAFSRDEVLSAAKGDRGGLVLSLTPDAADLLQQSGAGRLAIMQSGRLLTAPAIGAVQSDGSVSLRNLSEGQARRVSSALGSVTVGPTIRLVPSQTAVRPGESISVDVYLEGVQGLRTYQVMVEVVGGTRGTLVRNPGLVDDGRADYVFGTRQKVAAFDDNRGRMGATLFNGTVDSSNGYLGTFRYTASQDASGTHVIRIVSEQGASFLADEDQNKMDFRTVNASVTVGARDVRYTR